VRRSTLNHSYRLIWSHVQQALVAIAETGKGRGKQGGRSKAIAGSVLAALALLAQIEAQAAPCGTISNSTTISGAVTGSCNLDGSFYDVVIESTGTISGSNLGIFSDSLSGYGAINVINQGTISGSISGSSDAAGIRNGSLGVVDLSIINNGLISSSSYAIDNLANAFISSINNTGTIAGDYGIFNGYAGIIADITNSGTISGSIAIDNYTGLIGNITNSGLIVGNPANPFTIGLENVEGRISGIGNSGTISGGHYGIYNSGSTASILFNGINNSGLISGTIGIMNEGGLINSGDVGISNSGTISGGISNSGTISGSSAGIRNDTGTIAGDLNNSGTIVASGGNGIDGAFGIITGDLINSGTISGSNSGIYFNGGTLSGGLTNSGTISGTATSGIYNSIATMDGAIDNSGTISGNNYAIWNALGTISGGITNSGTLSASGLWGILNSDGSIGGITNSGTIAGGSYGIQSDGFSTISGDIINSGTISGSFKSIDLGSSIFTGEIIVRGTDTARFIGAVDAPNNAMRVASGASYALVGDEYFSVSSLINNGTLKVADTGSGTATVTGDFSNTGTFNTRVTDTSYGRLAVTGNVALGGTLFVDASTVTSSNTYSSGTLAGVIAGATSSGSFTSYSDNSTLFNFTPVYTSTGFDLTIAAAPGNGVYDAVVNTGNSAGQGAAKVLDRLIQADPAGPIASLFVPLNGNQAISSAVSETLPVLNGGGQQASFSLIRNTTQNIQSRQDAVRGLNSGDDMLTDQHLWFKAFGSWLDQDNRKGVSGYNGNTYGFTAGADGELTEQDRIGAAFTYAKADLNASTNSAVVDLYQLTGYGSHDLNETTWLDYQAGVGQNVNTGDRDIRFANRTAKSDYKSYTANAGVGLSQRIPLAGSTSFIPSVRADYLWLRDESYTEKDAGVLNLKVNSNTADAFIVGLDGKLNHQTEAGYSLTANAGIGYDLIHDRTSITAAYAGALGSSFVTNGIDQSPWIARGGLGVSRDIASGISLQARYDIEHRSDFINQTAALKIRWGF
jgi:uncharacterized protein with beta-barrel porin domain